ncbi:uncharacterized protein LOC111864953 [Cryptotermes secundus]|nr:uncharacterized protein LOC111864953 [Cryptotermes secundus]
MGRLVIALFLEIILLAFGIQTGESIHCYTCNSRTNPKCADPVDKNGLEPMQCTKSTLEEASETVRKGIENLGNLLGFQGIPEGSDLKLACQKLALSDHSGNRVTFRSCSVARSESVDPCAMTDSMSNLLKGQGKVEFCETCETDLCNGSSHHSVTIMSALLVPCFAIFISRWVGV